MKKFYLILAMVLLCAAGIFAQERFLTKVFRGAAAANIPAITAATSDEGLVFSYCGEPVSIAGFAANYEVEAEMVIPSAVAGKYAGASITKLRVAFGQVATNTNVYIRSSSADAGYTQPVTFKPNQWNEIVLTTPYPIVQGEDLHIGYHYKGGGAGAFYSMTVDVDAAALPDGGQFRARASSSGTYSQWYASSEQGWGNICIAAVLEGDNLPQADVDFQTLTLPHSPIGTGKSFVINGAFENVAAKTVTSLDVSYQVGQEPAVIQTVSGLSVAPGETGEFSIYNANFAGSATEEYPVTVTIEKINGLADEDPVNNTLSGTIKYWDEPTTSPAFVSTSAANKNVLIEEYTGIACQFCPDGHKRVNQLIDQNPGRVFAINIHQGQYAEDRTPNYTTEWGDALANQTGLGGYPSGTVNRHIFEGGVTALDRTRWAVQVPKILAQPSYVNVAAEATINHAARKLTVIVELYYTGNSAVSNNLNVALLQDSIMGPQSFATGLTYPEMQHDGAYQHNHMLRHLLTGQWGDIIPPAQAGTYVVKRYEYDIPERIKNIPVNLYKLNILAFVAEGRQEIITGNSSVQNFVSGVENIKYAPVNIKIFGIENAVKFEGEYSNATIYDVSGRTVRNVTGNTQTVDVPAGIYLVKISIDAKDYMQKVVVR
ncbi:MAG: Omp28-related outer membrane protein [Prevotellaceae bacterium]|jgi:hypothetical protein|nr:Omp28-related outer membrane protein [Prevotellaceae bacterium]